MNSFPTIDNKRPNVVVIMSDQHHARFMGCAGDPLVQTPHLDGLAAGGVRFDNAYCSYPLCGPSRMSFMTGKLPYHTSCYTNTCQLRPDYPTFAHGFLADGYETVLAGRMHFIGYDQRHGFEKRIIRDIYPSAYRTGCGDRKPDRFEEMLRLAGGSRRKSLLLSGPGANPCHAYDQAVATQVEKWFEQRGQQENDRPFMLTVGLLLPHCPFIADADDFYHYYEKIGVEDLPEQRLETLHPLLQKLRHVMLLETPDPVTPETQRVVRAAYYAMCTEMDRVVGRVLAALDKSEYRENTIVVYCSDHGEALGEHGLWFKHTFYEGSAAVPLMMRWPGRLPAGKVVPNNVSLIDVGPTLLDFVGADPLPKTDGRSIRRLAETGVDPDWPDEVISENYEAPDEIGRMIRRGPWKLTYYHHQGGQLFNLEDDPEEFIDRWNDESCQSVRQDLLTRLMENWDPDEASRSVAKRGAEIRLFDQWARRTNPPEPDAHWYDDCPESRVDKIPGSSHDPETIV